MLLSENNKSKRCHNVRISNNKNNNNEKDNNLLLLQLVKLYLAEREYCQMNLRNIEDMKMEVVMKFVRQPSRHLPAQS